MNVCRQSLIPCALAVAALMMFAPVFAKDNKTSGSQTQATPDTWEAKKEQHQNSAKAKGKVPEYGAIASAHPMATEAGLSMLAQGGNAFDAAVATSAMLSVVEPISSGIGGGGFFLLHESKTGKNVFIDAREVAPESANSAAYLNAEGKLDRDRSINGPWSAGIPGLPAGLVHVAQHYGKLPLKQSLAPAIEAAEQGFPVYERLVKGYERRKEVMQRYPASVAVYEANGRPIQMGDVLVQKDLADTLKRLAEQGHKGFYQGKVAKKLVAAVNEAGGQWNEAELRAYRVVERAPIEFQWGKWHVVTAPPPSSGGVALAEILNVLEAWPLGRMEAHQRIHLSVEAMRRAYRDRTLYLGDPDFVAMPIERLTSDAYAAGLRAGIHTEKATPSALLPGHKAPKEDPETTHFSVIDKEGNRVATTQTVNLLYGSGLIAKGTGVLLNNEMDDFALKPGTPNAFGVMGYEANAVQPKKRMLSSMTPTFMESDEQLAILGTPGGSRIITMVLLGMLGVDAGLDPQTITALPRFHHQYLPDAISIEHQAWSPELKAKLEQKGHSIKESSGTWGNMQMLDWDKRTKQVRAGGDPRNPQSSAVVR